MCPKCWLIFDLTPFHLGLNLQIAMKKALLIITISSMGALYSCKKETDDYVCRCSFYDPILNAPGVRVHEIDDATEEGAKKDCKQYEEAYTAISGKLTTCGLGLQ